MPTSDLDEEWTGVLEAHLEWVDGWISPGSESRFAGPHGRESLVATILEHGAIEADETVKLQALGTYMGQAIVEHTGWSWCVVTDEYGSDLAVKFAEPDACVFPTTLISKRIEAGEDVDAGALFMGVIEAATTAKAEVERE